MSYVQYPEFNAQDVLNAGSVRYDFSSRNRRGRVHRVELRAALGAGPPGRPRRRVRPAHLRRQPDQPRRRRDRITFVQGDIGLGRPRPVDRRGRELRRRVAQQPRGPRPGRVLPHERDRHPGAAARRPGGRRRAASTTSRRARSTATSPSTPTTPFTEESPYRPRTPYNASKAGADHAVRAYHETFGLPITITNCANNYGPYQFPEKVIPLFTTLCARRRAAAAVRVDARTGASGSTCSTTAGRSTPCSSDGRVGETYHVGTRRRDERSRRSPTLVLDDARQAAIAEDDRPRPARARPPLPARLDEDPAELGWEPRGRRSTRARRDGPLVRREPRLVGAAARPRPVAETAWTR